MTGIRTAGELADYLAAQPRDRRVVLESWDGSWPPLAQAGEAGYVPDGEYDGQVYEPGASPDGAERVVILGPVP